MNRFTNIITTIMESIRYSSPSDMEKSGVFGEMPLYPKFPQGTKMDRAERRSEYAKVYKQYVEDLKRWSDSISTNVLLWRKLDDKDGDRLYMLSPNVSGENGDGWRVTVYSNDEWSDGYQPITHSEESTKFDALLKHDVSGDNIEFLDKFPTT